MSTKAKILIITGDAGESYECLYAKHRFEEAGYQSVIAAPSKKRMNLVILIFIDWCLAVWRAEKA